MNDTPRLETNKSNYKRAHNFQHKYLMMLLLVTATLCFSTSTTYANPYVTPLTSCSLGVGHNNDNGHAKSLVGFFWYLDQKGTLEGEENIGGIRTEFQSSYDGLSTLSVSLGSTQASGFANIQKGIFVSGNAQSADANSGGGCRDVLTFYNSNQDNHVVSIPFKFFIKFNNFSGSKTDNPFAGAFYRVYLYTDIYTAYGGYISPGPTSLNFDLRDSISSPSFSLPPSLIEAAFILPDDTISLGIKVGIATELRYRNIEGDGSADCSFEYQLGPLPEGVTCQSESGVFPGCDSIIEDNISISKVEVGQAILDFDMDNDGDIDLVKDRKCVVLATVETTNEITDPIPVEVYLDGDLINPIATKECTFEAGNLSMEVPIMFTPTDNGLHTITVAVDPNNIIAEESPDKVSDDVSIFVRETKGMKLVYVPLAHPDCDECFDEVGQLQQAKDHVTDSNQFIQYTYPVPDDGITGSLTKKISGHDNTVIETVKSPCGEITISNGYNNDLRRLESMSWANGNPKRVIGIIPQGYVTYHEIPDNVVGIHADGSAVLVQVGYTVVTAHEIGHTFGFEEGYTDNEEIPGCQVTANDVSIDDGYNVYVGERGERIKDARDFMESQRGKPAWISSGHWEELVNKLSISEKDPELINVSAIISKDGTVELGDWAVKDGIPDFIEPGSYTIRIRNDIGALLTEIPFNLSFIINLDPLGAFNSSTTYISHAIPYPIDAASIAIVGPDGETLVEVDPISQLLKDAVGRIPDSCFLIDETSQRSELENKIVELEEILSNLNLEGATAFIETDMLPFVNEALANQCEEGDAWFTSKEQLIEILARNMLHIDARLSSLDTDDDGIMNNKDICPNSNLSNTVIIDGCNSGVRNILMDNGCTISDEIFNCANGSNNHGQFVKCVSKLTNRLKKEGKLSGNKKGKIQSCAAQADLPK